MLNTTHHISQVGNMVAHQHMSSTELAANLFRATQTEEKLKRDQVSNKAHANQTHFEVGAKVRATIEELCGTMPEDLPTPEKVGG
ncbi:DNA-damage-inducible protein D [Photobacterium damselae]|nr:DNA-damage-inducible protein D [Photobacterium damselae]